MAAHLTGSDFEGFKKCCLSNAMDGSEDDVVWKDSEEDWTVRNECEEDEGTDYEDGESDTYWGWKC
jgi:hypothetical protein